MPDATLSAAEATRPDGRSAFLFDPVFYLAANPDLALLAEDPEFDPEEHFWREGIWDGREPSAFYDIDHLQRVLKGGAFGPVTRAQALPLFFGLPPEGRPVPNAWFNPAFFRARHGADFPDAAGLPDFPLFEFYAANAGPLSLAPNALFDEAAYQARYPDVAAQVAAGRIGSGFQHFVMTGWREARVAIPGAWAGRSPDAAMKRAERDMLLGARTGAELAWWFDEEFYLALHRDVDAMRRAGTVRSGLEHFLLAGFAEHRAPHPALAGAFRERAGDASLESMLDGLAPNENRGLPLAEAVALRRQVLDQGWSTDESALTELLWDFVEAPAVPGHFDAAAYLASNPDVAPRIAAGEFADAAAHWRAAGMAENRLAPCSSVFAGRRASLREIARGGVGVNYLGPLSLASEAGGAARDMMAALEAAGLAVAAIDVSGLFDPRARMDLTVPDDLPHAFTLVDLPPERILPLVARLGAGLFDRRMTIGLFPSAAPRPGWRAVLGGFDAILTPGAWSARGLAGITGRAVLAAPRPLDVARLRAAAQSARHPVLDRLRRDQRDGRHVVLFTMGEGDDPASRGLDLFLALARQVSGEDPDSYRFCVKAAARSATGPGLAPLLGDAPMQLIDEPWDEGQLAALRALADVAVFPDRSSGNERAALASIALGVPTLVSLRADLPELLGADYPLGIPGRLREPADPARGDAPWFEPDAEALARLFAAHAQAPRRFRPWPRRIATRLAPAEVGQALRALLVAHCGFDGRLDGLGETLDAATDQAFTLAPAPPGPALGRAVAGALAPLFTLVSPMRSAATALQADLAAQDWPGWAWCLVADGTPEPAGLRQADARISAAPDLPAACGLATGRYLLFPAPGDRLAPGLLAAYAARIAADPAPDLLYCDREGLGTPDWSPEHLLATPYPGRSLCISAALFFRVGGASLGIGTAGLHDLALRALAAAAAVAHVEGALHRPGPDLEPETEGAGIAILEAHLARVGLAGSAEAGLLPGTFRIRPTPVSGTVTAIVLSGCERAPGVDGPVLHVERFLRSIQAHGTDLPIALHIVVDRGREAEVAHLAALDPAIRVLGYDPPGPGFNFAAKANAAIRATGGETVILLNDDMEALDAGWARALAEPLELPGVGIVGARLVYPDGSLQHAGIVLGGPEATRHPFVGVPAEAEGSGFTRIMRNTAAVTAACMAFRRGTFEQAGGFDERFAVDFNDTDFCLRVLGLGLRVVYTPFATLRHHESQTVTRARADALERRAFQRRWQTLIRRDPYAPSVSPPYG